MTQKSEEEIKKEIEELRNKKYNKFREDGNYNQFYSKTINQLNIKQAELNILTEHNKEVSDAIDEMNNNECGFGNHHIDKEELKSRLGLGK